MLRIIKKQLPVELTEEIASGLRQNLQGRYNSLLHKVRLEYLDRLGLEPDACDLTAACKDSSLILGELYLPEAGTIFYIKAKRGENIVQAGVITSDETRDAEEFFSEIRDILSGICDSVPSWQQGDDFSGMKIEDAEIAEDVVTSEQITAAKSLMDRESRDLLDHIKDVGSIFLNKIEYTDREVLEKRIHNFTDLGLLSMDYAVLCRRTGQQILRVSDKATIGSQKDFKCFICGNQIADEVVEEVLACTDSGKAMLSERNWLVILVRGILAELGIPGSALRIYRSRELPVQIFLSINGLRYLLVLCTEPMTLDQAYLVGAHLAAYKIDSAIVISTEKVTTLMRSHLEQLSSSVKFEFLDNIEGLNVRLQRIIYEQQRCYMRQLLSELSVLTKVDIAALVLQRMLPIPKHLEEVPVAEAAPAPEAAPEAPAAAEEISSEAAPAEEASADGFESSKGKKGKKRH